MGELSCNTIITTTSSTSNTTTFTTTLYRVCVAYQDCLKSNRHESSEPSENEAAFGKRSIRASRTQVQIQPFDACVDGSVSNLVNRCTFQLRQLPGRRSSSSSHQTVSRTSRLCSVCTPPSTSCAVRWSQVEFGFPSDGCPLKPQSPPLHRKKLFCTF